MRDLARSRRDLPNDFDVENVAEEIASVARSELAAVESRIRHTLVHLIRLGLEPGGSRRPLAIGIAGFHAELLGRLAP